MATKTNAQRLRESWGKKFEEDEKTSSSTKQSNTNSERLGKAWGSKTIGLDTLESDLSSMGKTIEGVYNGWQTKETMENTRTSVQSMYDRLGKYQEYQKKYGGTDLSELQNSYKSILDGWDDVAKTYGRYKSADAYNKALKLAEEQAAEYEGMKTANLGAVQKEVADLEKIFAIAKGYDDKAVDFSKKSINIRNASAIDGFSQSLKKLTDERDAYLKSVGYENMDALEKALGEKKMYYGKAQRVQDGIALSSVADVNSENYDKDFNKYAEKGKALGKEKEKGLGAVGYKNQIAYLRENPDVLEDYEQISNENGAIINSIFDNQLTYVAAKYMTDEEAKTYNYYMGKYDEEGAEKYLKAIEESLKQRQGSAIYKERESNLSKYTFGYTAGIDQFTQGIINEFNTKDDYIPTTGIQNASGLVREDIKYEHGTLGQIGYDLINTTSNMMPSILTSAVIGTVNPVIGGYVGAGLMGTSAAGNAYQEMLNLGYDKGQARTYSTLVGLSEAGLQSIMGGIGKLGGVSGKLSKIVSGIDNGLARFAVRWGGSALSEGFEEAAQEILTPIFQNFAAGYDTGADIDWSEVVYSGLLGALSGGVLEGGDVALNSYAESSLNKNMGQNIKANERVSDVFDIASNPEVASAYETYTRYANKGINADNITDAQLGSLYTSAKADAVETIKSKKTTDEQKQSAYKTLARLSVADTENKVKKEAKKFNVGEETKVTESGVAVDVKDLKIKGDEVTVATDKGEISVDDITLAQNDAELVVLAKGIAKTEGEDVANLFLKQYDGKTDAEEYANAFNLTMAYAKNDYTYDTILNKKGALSTEQVNVIYAETRIKADRERQEAIDKLIKDTADKTFYKGYIDDSAITEEVWGKLDSRQKQAVTFIKGFAQVTGMNLVLTHNPDSKHGGAYNVKDNTITIDIAKYEDSVKALKETIIPTMSHETTHWMEEKSPELWRRMNELVFSTLQEADGISEEARISIEMTRLKNKGRKATEKEARSEIIARACEDMLSMSEQGKKMFNSLSESEQKTFVDKIKELIQNLKDWVSELLGMYKSDSYEAQLMRQYEEKLNELSKLWDEMLVKSVEANQALEKSGAFRNENTAEGDVLFHTRSVNGNEVVWIEENILKENKGQPVHQFIADFIAEHIGDVYTLIESGQKVYIGEDLPGEYTQSKYTQKVLQKSPNTIKAKNKAAANIKEIIEIATNRRWEKTEHTDNKDAKYGMYRYDTRFGFPVKDSKGNVVSANIYKAELVIRNASDGRKYLYDIVDIKKDTVSSDWMSKKISSAADFSAGQKNNVSKDSILNPDKNVKEKFADRDDMRANLTELNKEYTQLERELSAIKKSDEYLKFVEELSTLPPGEEYDRAMKEYGKWVHTVGFYSKSKRMNKIKEEQKNLKSIIDNEDAMSREAFMKSIDNLTKGEKMEIVNKAVATYGTTDNVSFASYLMLNGEMLDFSEGQGYRVKDHREISEILDMPESAEYSDSLIAFMNMGNIRMQTYGIDISQAPNQEQKTALRDIISQVMRENDEFSVDFSKSNGYTDGSVTYPKGTSASKILADIDSYFESGVVPEYESSISEFLYADRDADVKTQINTSMTMDEAKQMIQRAFVIGGIKEWYEGEYKNGDEWLRGEGVAEVALNIENEYTLTEKYLNKLQGYIDGDFYVEDILDAYLHGTLVGKEKPKAKRLDISKEYRINDERFYSPQRIKDVKKLFNVATQRVTEKNRTEVSNARAKILIFAHNKGASELLSMTQAELNKKLRAWSNYSAKARDISKRFNNGVADSNKWTGIENCSWLYKGTVTTKDLESLVKSVKGASSDYEKLYIARTMLALDTHIDWSWLSFEFDTYNGVNKEKTFSISKCLGYYTNENRKIVVTHDKPNTVAHEMGHALDYQWARDLGYISTALTEVSRHTEKITDAETRQFFDNFKIFIDSLTDNGDIRSEYTQNPKEVFARFVARFVEWVDNTGTGRNNYNLETSYYNDKFTASHYIEFVKLLQEKAMLDAKKMEVGANEEVRFSDREDTSVYDLMGEKERLLKENEKFKAEVERLKERLKIERKVTNGNFFNENQLGAAAGHLRNISRSTINKAKLVESLKDVYTFIAHTPELTWEEVFEKCYHIAEDMLAEAKPETMVDDYSKQILDEIRHTRIALDHEQKKEAEYIFGKNWNRYFFNRVIISNDGIDIDAKWQEWSHTYPDIFKEGISDMGMISELYDIINSLRDASETVIEYDTEEQTRWLAREIYNQYWNVSTIKTTADKYDRQIRRLNFEHRRIMTEFREEYNSRLKEQHKADKEKYKELIAKIRERKDNELAAAKQHGKERLNTFKENAERKTRIQRITANALSLNEMLVKNSKDKHVPEILREPVTALLQAIDFSSKRLLEKGEPTQKDISLSKALSKVKDMMVKATNAHDELVELYGHGLDEDIEKMVDSVDNIMRNVGDNEFVINRMTLADLQTLDKMVKTIKHAVNKMNKFHTVNHVKGIANLSQESVLYLDSLGKGKIYDGKRGAIKKLLDWGNALPYYVFKRYGSGGMKVYEALQDGWDKFAFNVKEIIDYANETYTSKEVKEWSEDVKTFKILIPASEYDLAREDYAPQYQEIQLTVPQIMSMYCLNKREQARGHLFKGGIRVADFKDSKGKIVSQADGIIFTEKDVQTIFDSLTDRQKAVADKLQEFMNTVCSDWGNDVSMARFGYKAFGEENYFPIQSDKNNLAVNDETEQPNSLFKLLNMSFTKSTIEKADNRIVISDIFDVFAQHTSDMAKYNALALPVLDSFKWYNYKERQNIADGTFKTSGVKQSIEKAFGKDGQNYFTTFLKDINGQQEVSRDTLGKGFFSNAKIAAVGMNLRVVLLQPTSYVRASAVIDNKYLMKALGHKPKIKRAETHCGIALWKSMGYYDTNIQRGLEAQIKHADTLKDKATDWSMKGAEMADKVTWGYLWNACELEIREKRKDLKVGSKEFYDAIGKRLREVIYATQVVDSTMTRSQMMRSSDGRDKMLTAFASEPTLSYNMLQDAYMELSLDTRRMGKAEAIKKNGKRIARIVWAYTMTNALAALVESGFDAFRDDDDEEMDMIEFMKLYLSNFASDMSITGKIPYIKEIHSMIKGFSASRTDTQWMEGMTKAITTWYKIFNGKGNASTAIKNSIKAISDLSGLPFYNVYRDMMAALNKLDLFTTEDLNEMFEDFFN